MRPGVVALLVLGLLAASDGAGAVTLRPLAWAEAGYGNPSAMDLSGIVGEQRCLETGWLPCRGVAAGPVAPSAGATLALSTGAVDFHADVASSASGASWTTGLRDLALSIPPIPTDPDAPAPGDLDLLQLALYAFAYATIDVPASGGDLVFRRSPAAPVVLQPFVYSDVRETTLPLEFGVAQSFDPGDHLTVVQVVPFELIFVTVQELEGAAQYVTLETLCTLGGTAIDLSDCVLSISASQVVPEPRLATLLGAAAGLAALRRWRR